MLTKKSALDKKALPFSKSTAYAAQQYVLRIYNKPEAESNAQSDQLDQ
jgi:hypothetical protein